MKSIIQTSLIAIGLSVASFSVTAQDLSEQYNACQDRIKTVLGDTANVSMKSSKTRKGVITIKLGVVPPEGGRTIMTCVADPEVEGGVVVTAKNGDQV
jgi:hypothetical protein